MLVIILITIAAGFAAGYTVRGLLAVALERKRRRQSRTAYEQTWLEWAQAGHHGRFPSFGTWEQLHSPSALSDQLLADLQLPGSGPH